MQTPNQHIPKQFSTVSEKDAEVLRRVLGRISQEIARIEKEISCLRPLIQGAHDKMKIKECLEKINLHNT